jgi:glycosyltransferase involved in cell wall biosynthesis
MAVISWDVGHNPLGRANVLAEVLARRFDVELWGAQFERYGSEVWAPLRRAATPINLFAGDELPAHLRTMAHVAERIDADLVWVSKPRLPSYLLGIDAKLARNRPLVLDVDDHELAFFGEDDGLTVQDLSGTRSRDELRWPFERDWTRLCDTYIDAADLVTVSNTALQERYGGLIVPHARDERRFDPARFDREATRARLGVRPDERLLLFGGTPRAHKGVVEVLEALERLGDDRYRVLMFGTKEFDELKGRIGDLARWARVLPAQSFDDLPELVNAADLACVIQDPAHPVSRYQMPAKVSDALAMGVPCLVTRTPPLAPLVDQGVLQVLEPGDALHERIARVFDDHADARARADRGRDLFLREYSYEAVADRLAPVFGGLLETTPPVSPRLRELAAAPAEIWSSSTGAGAAPAASGPPAGPARKPRRQDPEAAPLEPGAVFDVVMFWKQNDSGIYGRRQDMFLEELARSPRVGTIVHFDNPISPEALLASYRAGWRRAADQRRLVATESVARALGRRDQPGVHRHTFVFGGTYSRRLGRPRRGAYVAHVRSVLAGHGVGTGQRPVVVWAYPTNDDLPALIDALEPALVVADVVDDNRHWYEPDDPHHARIERNYEAVLARSDVVLANCEPVARSMARFAPDVRVVPNGLELPTGAPIGPPPAAVAALGRPLVAYVGNLSDRIDLALLEAVARARPRWNLALVGSAHRDPAALALDRLPNVHLLGVMPYREVRQFLAHVDVALIPHVDNEMTRSMNPLKAFVYASAGVPVVSTPVANLPDFGGLITVAEGADEFVAAIEAHLDAGRPDVDLDLLRPHSWSERVAQVFDIVDELLAGPA